MTYKPTEKEILAVLNSGIDARMRYFVHKVASQEHLRLTYDAEGNLFAGYDADGVECVVAWPFEVYGQIFLDESQNKQFLKAMSIHKFLGEYVDELFGNGISMFIFPNKTLQGALLPADVFRDMMEDELAKYGDCDWKDF
ncbi:MAG: DUF2750 domain-containing protein [Puniceicoccales bacterium]|jgi:hypothetical protein|nr:DUF2750 domain-containing protein [Puniceicoccales bacterium]